MRGLDCRVGEKKGGSFVFVFWTGLTNTSKPVFQEVDGKGSAMSTSENKNKNSKMESLLAVLASQKRTESFLRNIEVIGQMLSYYNRF